MKKKYEKWEGGGDEGGGMGDLGGVREGGAREERWSKKG